jgi:hypothetical protein
MAWVGAIDRPAPFHQYAFVHYSTFVEGMKGLKPGETCLTAWVKTQRLAAGSFCQNIPDTLLSGA